MKAERLLTITEAKNTSGMLLRPCRSCDLAPESCEKQYGASVETVPETSVMCMIKGWVRREEKFVRIERNGQPDTNTSLPYEIGSALQVN